MSNRRRTQFGAAAFTEAARRQLMQPVTCWERVVASPPTVPGSTVKISKWVTTNKTQQFSDDEGDTEDQPLVPLPEEPDGDEEMDQEDSQVPEVATENTTPAPVQPPQTESPPPITRAPTPKTELTMPSMIQEEDTSGLAASLAPAMHTLGVEGATVVDPMGEPLPMDLESLEVGGGLQTDLSALERDSLLATVGDPLLVPAPTVSDNPFPVTEPGL